MAVTYGFYDSLNHDRLYNAQQMSAIFDGIINDGVFMSVGNQFHTVAGTGMQVIVKSGRAWFDSTWTLNDAEYPLSIDAADVLLTRIDAVVLEVNSEVATRANTIKVVKGTPASTPAKPALTNTAAVHQHALAYVTVAKNTTAITNSMIEIVVGKTETPYVTAILQTTDITDLFNQWEDYFQTWFDNVRSTLDGDVALNLQNQITTLERSILKADTKTAMGLPSDAVGDDAFKYLINNTLLLKDKIDIYDMIVDMFSTNNITANISYSNYIYNQIIRYSQKDEYILMLYIGTVSSSQSANGFSKGLLYNIKTKTFSHITGSGSSSDSHGSSYYNNVRNIVVDPTHLAGIISISTNTTQFTNNEYMYLDYIYFDDSEKKIKYKNITSGMQKSPAGGSYLYANYCNDGIAIVSSGGRYIAFIVFNIEPDVPANSTIIKWQNTNDEISAIPEHYGESACVVTISKNTFGWLVCSKNTKKITSYYIANYLDKIYNLSESYSKATYDYSKSLFINNRYYICPYAYYFNNHADVYYFFVCCVDVITGEIVFTTKNTIANTCSLSDFDSVHVDHDIYNGYIYYYINNKIYRISMDGTPAMDSVYDLYSIAAPLLSSASSSNSKGVKIMKTVLDNKKPIIYMYNYGYDSITVVDLKNMKTKRYTYLTDKENNFAYFNQDTKEQFVTGITIVSNSALDRKLSQMKLRGR